MKKGLALLLTVVGCRVLAATAQGAQKVRGRGCVRGQLQRARSSSRS